MRYRGSRAVVDKIAIVPLPLYADRTKQIAQRDSERRYVSTVNSNPLVKKVFKRIKKIKVRSESSRTQILNTHGTIEFNPSKVSETWRVTYRK